MAKSRKSSGRDSPTDLARLEHGAREEFSFVNPMASDLIDAIRRTSHYGREEKSGPDKIIVIDRRAVLLGLIASGLDNPRRTSASGWLVRRIKTDLGHDASALADLVKRHDKAASNAQLFAGGATLMLSQSVTTLESDALSLVEESRDSTLMELHHFLFAFLVSPGQEWDVFRPRPEAQQLRRLAQRMIPEIVEAESEDDVTVWHEALATQPANATTGEATEAAYVGTPSEGSFAIDKHRLAKLRDSFLARFPDFKDHGFEGNEGEYWRTEREYKQKLIDAAAEALHAVGYPEGDPADVGAAILQVVTSRGSNLLDWREVRRLDEVRREAPGLVERALGEMVQWTYPPSESVARCIQAIAGAYLEGQEENRPFAHLRTLPTTALALAKPAEAIAVRYTTMHRAAVALTGQPVFRNAPMSALEYERVLEIADQIGVVMRMDWGWRPRDLWDVQGFLWVATGADAAGAADEDGSQTPQKTAVQDRYPTQADDPATVDCLERAPFAAVLAKRIIEIRESARTDDAEGDRAFMVHLHGPWGSGKSSILNLLRQQLETPKSGPPSLVVIFNAWKQQRMRPPWWALMNAIYRTAVGRGTGWREHFRLWTTWWVWRWKAEMLPLLLVASLVGGLTFLVLSAKTLGSIETIVKIGVTAAAALGTVYAYSRVMIFGSQKAAQAYADLTTDPYRRVVELFNRLVYRIQPPLVVFIDDLDRCDSGYVVELLEGIQTLFRHAPVTYVVAADRKWICSSFEKKYGDFSATIGEPCRPLGYLFLDKLFQISAEMPRLTREVQAAYLADLLREDSPREPEISAEVIAEAEARVSGVTDEAELHRLIAEERAETPSAEKRRASHDLQRALRQASALQITSAPASAETEHRLQKVAHLLEPNPRSMKRLVNAVAMAQARGLLEGRAASPETRARWAMLSLRWPILADFLADHPAAVAHWSKGNGKSGQTPPSDHWPPAVKTLHGDPAVIDVVGGGGDEGALTPETLATVV